jgi:hypothetical protein
MAGKTGFHPAPVGLVLVLAAFLAPRGVSGAPKKEAVTGESSIEIKQVEAFSKLDFILPDGQLSSRIEARRSLTGIGLVTFYDFPKGVISYRARLFTGFGPWTVGMSVFDRVEFERVLVSRKFIGRVRGVAWDLGRDLGRRYKTTLTLSNQENRLIELSGGEEREEGQDLSRQNTASLSLVKDEFPPEDPEAPGYRYEFRTSQGVRQFGGDFEYNKVEFSDEHRFPLLFFRNGFSLRGGAPAYQFNYPVFERFTLGGWDSMRGFPVNHFEGEKMAWAREEWSIPVFSFSGRWWIFAPKALGLIASAEAGRAGDDDRDFFLSRRYALSACGGLVFRWAFRDRVPIQLTFAWGKALEDRDGVFYFRYRIR